MLFHLFFCPSPSKIIISTDFNFFDFRVVLQELFQYVRWLFKTFALYLYIFFRSSDSPKGKPVFILLSLFQCHMCQCINTSFVNSNPIRLFSRRNTKTVLFFTSCLFHLESFSIFFIDPPQEGISRFSRFIFPDKNSIMVRNTFIKDFL